MSRLGLLLNLSLSRSLAERLPNARFETIPNAGHIANLDNPQAFNPAVNAFLMR
jgi:3-oxoadipate enol-lactonase